MKDLTEDPRVGNAPTDEEIATWAKVERWKLQAARDGIATATKVSGGDRGDRIVTKGDWAEFGFPSERAFADYLRRAPFSFGRPSRAHARDVVAALEARRKRVPDPPANDDDSAYLALVQGGRR